MHLFALPLSTLPLLAQATPPPNSDVTTVWSTVWIPLLWLCGSILFGLVVLFFTYRFLLRTHQTRALKKFHALFSLLPFQAGVTSQNGRMLTYRSGQGDPIEDEDIPKTVSDLPAELQSEVQAGIAAAFTTSKPVCREYSAYGSFHKLDFWLLPENIFGETAVMWFSTDITQLHTVQVQSVQLEQRFRKTIDSIVDAVIGIDYDGGITMVNPAAEKLIGYERGQLVGRKFDECILISDTGADDRHGSLFSSVIRTGADITLGRNSALRRTNGEMLEIEGTISPVRAEDDLIIGAVLFFRNVTDEHRKQRQLQEAISLALAADQTKSNFLLTLSQDFRTPLNAVIGYSEMLQGGDISQSEWQHDLQAIHAAGEKLLSLLDTFLDFSQMTIAQGEPAELADVNLTTACAEILHLFQRSSAAKEITLDLALPSHLPTFRLNLKVLRQFLINLLGYCISAADDRSRLQLGASHQGDTLLLTLTCPVNPQLREDACILSDATAMDPARLAGTAGRARELIIARQLCELLKCTFAVDPDPPEGDIRYVLRFEGVKFAATPSETALPAFGANPTAAPKNSVLIIDDVSISLMVIGRMFDRLRIPHIKCNSATAALKEIGKAIPRAIFTDLWMPEVSGDELVKLLRASPQTADIPVFLVTSDTQVDASIRDLFSGIIFKPISINKLRETVETFLPDLLPAEEPAGQADTPAQNAQKEA